ncbi:MAG: nickel ABC transporter substrate-binding protein [Lachnospiraceae bacterium]
MKVKLFKNLLCTSMGLMLSCSLLAGCGTEGADESKSADVVNQSVGAEAADSTGGAEEGNGAKILSMAVGAELNTLYPLNMDIQNNVATKLCYEGLVNYVDGEIVPCLAERWEFSGDGKDLTFYLKEGVVYHDGTVFNGEAVKRVFEFGKENQNFSAIKAVANLDSVEVVDDYTVIFHYPAPYFAYLNDFCYPEVMILVSPEVIEDGNFQNMKDVVGTGPYVYDEIVDGSHVKFVKNNNYWGEKPYYDEIIVKYIPESSARLQALQNGEIDLIYGSALLTWDDYDQAITLPDIKGVVSEFDSNTRNLILNASSENLSDLKVREAIAYAIDKEALSAGLTWGHETAAIKLFPKGTPYTDTNLNIERTFDQAKAGSLLDEAGWVLNGSTGIREKNGKTLSVVFTYDAGNSINQSLATVIKSQLAEVGIDVTTTGQDMMTWWKEGFGGNYGITIWNTEQPYTSPHNYFTPMLNRSAHVPSLAGIADTKKFNACIEEFQQTDDSERVAEIFDYLLNFDNDNVIDLPLLYVKDMIVFNSEKIAGYEFTSTPMFFDITKLTPAQ